MSMEEVVFARRNGDVMLRVIKVSPYIDEETKKYAEGGVIIELVEVTDEDGEEVFGDGIEYVMTLDEASLLLNTLKMTIDECINECRTVVSAYFLKKAMYQEPDGKYIG